MSTAPKRKSPAGVATSDLTLSAYAGTNDDLFPKILKLYVPTGGKVADTTFGRGVFWRQIPEGTYQVFATDLQTGVDARSLPYEADSMDCVVFDPPYMHSSGGTSRQGGQHAAFERYYQNNVQARVSDGHLAVLQLYFEAAREAQRVVKKTGVYVIKCQDEICANRQRLTHVEIINELSQNGWICEDLFVLLQTGRPGVSRMIKQLHSRKAHSYFLVMRRSDGKKVWTGPVVAQ